MDIETYKEIQRICLEEVLQTADDIANGMNDVRENEMWYWLGKLSVVTDVLEDLNTKKKK